jgi:hypothetical protein
MTRKHARRLITMVLTAAIAALPLYGCGAANTAPASDSAAEEAQVSGDAAAEAQTPVAAAEVTPAYKPGEEDPEILKTISEMSAQEKLAQMMIVAFRSDVIKRPLG